MDLSINELEKRVGKLIESQQNPPGNPVDLIVERTDYSKQFVAYVLESISLHYSDLALIEHMVRFVAEKCKQLKPPVKIHSTIIPAFVFSRQIQPICQKLKEDSAFGFDDGFEDEEEGADVAKEFPLLTRFAIVATYCASYNPPATDKRFFFKGKDLLKRRQKAGAPPKTQREKCHELGPRPFDHQRGQFIFLFFCRHFDELFKAYEETDMQIDFTSQITHLISAGLLKVTSARENFDMPMYISLCGLDFVKCVASSISREFDIERQFLHDFAYQD